MQDFKKSVVYQIYPKSFLDTNGDGLGELRGVTQKLDYLKELGVDYIWLTPFFVSPQNDNGYDVADYRTIDPRYGTMEDFEELAQQANRRGIRLMLDMVFNHTSTEHIWFQKALAGDPVYQDYYIFRPARPDGSAPTNWQSKFGGSAWEYAPPLISRALEPFCAFFRKPLANFLTQTIPPLSTDWPSVRYRKVSQLSFVLFSLILH